MSEREIRRLLRRACAELDRHAESARKAMLPTALGASLALAGCPGPPKSETAPEPVQTDRVEEVADAGQTPSVDPSVDEAAVADAGAAVAPPATAVPDAGAPEEAPPPDEATRTADAAVPVAPPRPPPDWNSKRPYMAPDALPLFAWIAADRVA